MAVAQVGERGETHKKPSSTITYSAQTVRRHEVTACPRPCQEILAHVPVLLLRKQAPSPRGGQSGNPTIVQASNSQ